MNTLKIIVKNGENYVHLEKSIDFIPSKGLIVNSPIHCIIEHVVYDISGYTATIDRVLEPTNPETQISYLRGIGFTDSTW